jgi:hypothetical protein
MLTKIYLYTWLAIGALFVAQYIAGSMTMLALVVFGFVAFGMVFMGMIAVLPTVSSHPDKGPEPEKIKVSTKPLMAPDRHGVQSVRV